MENRVKELFNDLAKAPIGSIKEDFSPVTMSDNFSDLLIKAVAEHLYSEGYIKKHHGLWIYERNSDGFRTCRCSECKTSYGCIDTPYCPSCGAEMKGFI